MKRKKRKTKKKVAKKRVVRKKAKRSVKSLKGAYLVKGSAKFKIKTGQVLIPIKAVKKIKAGLDDMIAKAVVF